MDLANHVHELKHENSPFHLPPAGEILVVASVQMRVGDGRGFYDGFVAKAVDKDGGFVE